MSNAAPEFPETDPTRGHLLATSAADQRIAALRSQLAMVQAERSLLHARSASPSVPPPARRQHGLGGWIFAGFSFVFFLAMIGFAATRPPAVRIVEVEVIREVEVPAAVAPVAAAMPDAQPMPSDESARAPARPPRGSTRGGDTSMRTTPMIEFDRCGGDPLCGS